MLSAVEIYSRERAWGWRTRNCNQGLLRRYILGISEVLRLGFPSCLEDFLELGFPLDGQEPRFKKCS